MAIQVIKLTKSQEKRDGSLKGVRKSRIFHASVDNEKAENFML